jgi:hypothetical protein
VLARVVPVLALAVACAACTRQGHRPGAPAGPRLVRGPYLQLATPTSVVVRWRTDVPTEGRLLVGRTPAELAGVAVDARPSVDHALAADHLTAETRYAYAITAGAATLAGADDAHAFVTPAPVGARRPLRVWALGDSGTGNDDARAVRDAYLRFAGDRAPDLWLMLGDNAYPRGTDAEFQRDLFDVYPTVLRRTALFATRGNHELADDGRGSAYYDAFSLPTAGEAGGLPSGTEAYYAFDRANVHFVCLDSFGSSRALDGAMARWLAADLAATTQDWIIAFFHHPPYSKGTHDSDREIELVEMRQNLVPILEAGGADLVLSGHSHGYERSFFLGGHYGPSGTFSPAAHVKAAGSGRADAPEGAYRKRAGRQGAVGTAYVVAGASGQVGRFTAGMNHPAMFVSLQRLGSLVLDVEGLALHVRYLDEAGATEDRFDVVKTPPPENEKGRAQARPSSAK